MPDYTSYKAAYDRDGFVLVRNFLPPDELANLTAQIARYIREVVPTLPDQSAFYQDKDRPETLKQLQKMGDYDAFFSGVPRPTALEGPSSNPHRRSCAGKPARVVQQAAADRTSHAAASGQFLLQPHAAQRRLHLAGPRSG